MRLLVSVRSAREAAAAVEGGADIVDAKEPLRGSLGPVDAAALARIADAVPSRMPLSIALGDPSTPEAVANAMNLLRAVARRPPELYVKVGLAGVTRAAEAQSVLAAAVRTARVAPLAAEVVAVAYADHDLAGALPAQALLDVAATAGVRGVLLDTWTKDGRSLFAWCAPSDLGRWLERARRRGLLTALAGSLSVDHLALISQLGPDVCGIRGAACDHGRAGEVGAALVRQLAQAAARPVPPPGVFA